MPRQDQHHTHPLSAGVVVVMELVPYDSDFAWQGMVVDIGDRC